ncbi:hypothetical protein [Nocardioides sp.]|uniref:hypothetical protein n=1 Tax=Nocardioides sp. TaxID=35761 RepID=UPI0035123A94
MRRALVISSALLVTTLTLSACDAVGEAASNAAGAAGCAVAQETLDQVTADARGAVDRLTSDPQAAQEDVRALSILLDTLDSTLGDDIAAPLTEARDAVDSLTDQARQAADGTQVDDVAVDAARAELDRAVADITQIC